ncbi:MAG TPA: glycosyltransferase family 2 protein [Candidatus Sulfotelmatobacter sp.]|nr:glycosyltransferase family 2 protein [Candidatus Sulfotelmatobacter sp.]HWI56822.1 glycosyltransferase family 2 protein [Bacillota bacterium]
MSWPTHCAAIIPCFNEAAAIAPVVAGVRRYVPTIFVVDDGSSDQTALLAERAGAEVLRHDRNRGKGAALQTGWQLAHQRGLEWGLMLDGDGQHAPEDIPACFQCAEQTAAALIVGNRMAEAAQMPALRRWVNRWMSRQLSTAAGQPLPDSQCGFRLMNLEAWSRLSLTTLHFEIESEMLLAFAAARLKIAFAPIRAIYKQEQSKIHPLHDTLRWFRWWRQVRQWPREHPGYLRACSSTRALK